MKSLSLLFFLPVLISCAGTPFIPTTNIVSVRVIWGEKGIRENCKPNQNACARSTALQGIKTDYHFATIYALLPRDWKDEERVCTLGEEFGHALGADH